jgi:hypothetical protein
MSRFGKIARLPLDIREQLNRRLQDGEIGKELVVWLNSVPEVQAVLKAEFGERPVNEPNLSDWRTGGYEDWLVHQETMQQVNQLVANAKELGGASQTPLSELLTTCLAARYVVELGRLTAPRTPREGTRPTAEAEGDKGCDLEGRKSRLKAAFPEREAEGDGGCDLERLRKICRDVLALRRLDLAAQRLRIEREAADREMRADEKQQKKEWLAAANAAVERENRRIDGLVWRLDHQNNPAYARCCVPLTPEEEAELFEGEEPEEEQSAGVPEAAGVAVEGQPVGAQEEQVGAQEPEVGGSQSSPLREEGTKADAKGAEKTGVAVAPGAAAQGGAGQSNKGELSKIKANKGKLRMPKTGAIPEAAAKAVRDAKILAGTLKEGE